MSQIVSITSQGQITVPKSMREVFGINGRAKASIIRDGNEIIIKPQKSFWSLAGSLKSKVVLSDKQLKKARQAFVQKWPKQ